MKRAYFNEKIYYCFDKKSIYDGGILIKELSDLQYKLLEYLINNSGIVCSVSSILNNVWGIRAEDTKGEAQLVRDTISDIRKINVIFRDKQILSNKRSIGYCLCISKLVDISESQNLCGNVDTDSFEMRIKGLLTELNNNQTIKLSQGFETNLFYSYLIKNSKKRLWIWGRKNKKLFDRSFVKYFREIKEKYSSGDFSLRILFLNPSIDNELLKTFQKKSNFSNALSGCIFDARDLLEEININFHEVCKCYSIQRAVPVIISDDVVFFTDIRLDDNGMPEHLTDSYFYITSVDSNLGKKYKKLFEDCWGMADRCEVVQ